MTTLLDRLFEIRDAQRLERQSGRVIIDGDALPWEHNAHGIQKWYMHPDLTGNALKSLIVFLQHIPPAGRTGVQRTQGGMVAYVWKGRGHSLVDGARHDWEAGDVLNFPVRTDGILVQHRNDDPVTEAQLLFVEPNTIDPLGVDRGSGFEQVEAAPASPGADR